MKAPLVIFSALTFASPLAISHPIGQEVFSSKPVLASLEDLKQIQAPIWAADEVTGIGFTYLTPELQSRLQAQSHLKGKCGGFEALDANEFNSLTRVQNELQKLRSLHNQNESARLGPMRTTVIQRRPMIDTALSNVQQTNLHEFVSWLSSFKSRNEKSAQASQHVVEMKAKADSFLKNWKGQWKTELVQHTSTQQQSLRVTLTGSTRPEEIVVLGGHHDSVASFFGGANGAAPGADDNASGSANLLEMLRILSEQGPSERTIEFMWYAAEESGLLGSAEIAKAYKAQKKDVVAVLQLDMTAYPGSGEMTISNVSDFTSPWLHELMRQLNQLYVGLKIIDDPCGYGCSDHASWYRQGYSTVVPFESLTATMNPNIHTVKDIVSPRLNFKHSAAITQLSLAFALELANSELRAP
ncbi:MAG: M20/M25/M40 family metallo-hydrolase [Pseudobdellovibrionaceae bacterium]